MDRAFIFLKYLIESGKRLGERIKRISSQADEYDQGYSAGISETFESFKKFRKNKKHTDKIIEHARKTGFLEAK